MQSTIIPSPPGNRLGVPRWSRALTAATALLVGALAPSQLSAQSVLAGWDFDPITNTSGFGASPLAATESAAVVTVGGLTRGSGVTTTGSGVANAWGANGWSGPTDAESAIDQGKFVTFTVTTLPGETVSIWSIDAFNVRRSGTGPTTGLFQYQLGAGPFVDIGGPITWGTTTSGAGNSISPINLGGFSELQAIPGNTTVTFRIVNYGATGTAGTWYLNDPAGTPDLDFKILGSVTGELPTPALTLSFDPTTLPENSASPFVGTITIVGPAPASDLTVTLSSDNTSAATVPATAIITAGNLTTTFNATPVAAPSSFANESSLITASADGYISASATVTATNVDVAPATTISLLANQDYTQNFGALGTTDYVGVVSATIGLQTSLGAVVGSPLNGWYVAKIAGDGGTLGNAPTSISPNNGSGQSGLVYNYGTTGDPDRALGLLASGSNTMSMGALIKNDSAQTFTGLTFSFTSEFWRSSQVIQNILTFGYGKIDNDFVTPDNFLTALEGVEGFSALDIAGPAPVASAGALNGNDPANQNVITGVSIPITLAPGETAFIRWQDVDNTSSDAGLAIDNLTITGVQSDLAFPLFDLPGGVYLTDQTVKVSNFGSYPSGTEVRYTTDGSTPTASSLLYNDVTGVPINTGNGNITLRAIALRSAPSQSSLVATATYQLPFNVANLSALRAAPVDTTIYRVLGQITYTAGTSTRNTKFFQDSAAGIQIDDFDGVVQSYSFGDNVAGITGRLSVFGGQLQFVPIADFGAPVSSGNGVTPLSRTLATLTDADQAMLVTLTGVSFESAGGNFGNFNSNTNISDASGPGVFRNIFGAVSDISQNVIPTGTSTVTGLIQKISGTTLTIGARNMSDIVSDSPGSTFASWAALYAPGQSAFADHDNDGVSNGLEYFMGETGSSFTPNPGIVDNKIVWPKNPAFVGSYSVQTSPDLVIWTDVGSTEVGNTVEFNFPPPGTGKVFARMKVIVTP